MGGFMLSRTKISVLLALAITVIVFAGNVAGDSNPGVTYDEVITSVPRTMTYQGILKDGSGDPVIDSAYSVIFRIFDQESGGSSLWDETMPCTTSAGYFSATFSNVTPRQKINMSAYAARSDTSDYAASGGGWVDDGLNVRLEASYDKVGIGTSTPTNKLHVTGAESSPIFNVEQTGSHRAARFYSQNACALWVEHAGNHGLRVSQAFGNGVHIEYALNDGIHVDSSNNFAGYFVGRGYFSGPVGIRTDSPQATLHVEGMGRFDSLMLPTGASSGYVLTSDGTGRGTWQAASGGADNDWTISGSDMYSAVSGNVGIGIESPSYKLDVHGTVGIDVDSNFADIPLTLSVPSNHTGLISRITKGGSVINVVDGSGNVGIGTFSPTAKLDVNGDIWGSYDLDINGTGAFAGGINTYDITTGLFRLTTGSSSGYVLTSDGIGNGTWQPASGGADSDWIISGPDMYSAVSGKVGIGISSPSYKLDVLGTMGIDVGSNYGDTPLTIDVPSNQGGLIFRIAKGGSVINVVDSAGNVGIGTFSPTAKLDVNGDIWGSYDLDINGTGSFAGGINADNISTSQFQMATGASSGYVLTSDGSGNGTWQALPAGVDASIESIDRIDAKIRELADIIETQSAKIAQLENKIVELEGQKE
jgi:hypothetical protein